MAKFELKEQGSETLLVFDHTGFPEGQAEHLSVGWKNNYLNLIESYLSK